MKKKNNFEQQYGEPFLSPVVRAQYVNLAEIDSGHKFSRDAFCITGLLPKKDKAGLKELFSEVEKMSGLDIDDVEKHPLLDGNGELRDGDSKDNREKEGHPGCYFFTCTRREDFGPPDLFIVGDNGEPEPCEASEIYPGCYVQLALQPAMYDEGCVTFYLNGVLKVEEGERFKASRVDSKSLFANWAKGAKVDETEEDESEEEETPKAKRGRPAGKLNGKTKTTLVAAKVLDEEEEEENEEDDETEEEDVSESEEEQEEIETEDEGAEEEEKPVVKKAALVVAPKKKLKMSIKELLD